MKRHITPVFLLTLVLTILGVGTAAAVLPSGNGQTTSAKSVSVVFASDAPGITATISGGATAAKQDTGNTSLGTIATNTTSIATSANQTNGTQKAQRVDGSGNIAPSGDTIGRAGFGKLTDGVTTVGVDVTSTGLKTLEQNQPVAEDNTAGRILVESRNTYANQTTATTTTVKSGAGFLHQVCVNTPVASATVKLFDNTAGSGTSMGVLTISSSLTNIDPWCMTYDVSFATGLTIVTSGATDVTESFR